MNCNTGHLVSERLLNSMDAARAAGYTGVPSHLQGAASKKLAGGDEATVSLTSGGKLAQWAASERKQKRMAKQARKRNR